MTSSGNIRKDKMYPSLKNVRGINQSMDEIIEWGDTPTIRKMAVRWVMGRNMDVCIGPKDPPEWN
jgi:hypothetical protein